MTATAESSSNVRERLGTWIDSPRVQWAIIVVILVNAAVLTLTTTDWGEADGATVLDAIDSLCLAIFVVELSIKLFAFGPRFLRSGWNVFDLLVVLVALVPWFGNMTVLRALRVLRVLRLASRVPSLRRVINALVGAVPGLVAVAAVLMIFYSVGTVMATMLFGEEFSDYFGDLGSSAFTLFTMMTLEGWPDVARDVMGEYPLAWAFFIPFVVVTSFAVLNLILAVIVDSMQRLIEEEVEDVGAKHRAEIDVKVIDQVEEQREEMRLLRSEIQQLREELRNR